MSAVLDLGIVFLDGNEENIDEDNMQVILIELNPFSKASGAALFDWHEDREILEKGPFEFRYY